MHQDRDVVTSQAINSGLFSNVLLALLKLSIGILGHSPALVADGINSSSDVIYYIAVKIFMVQAKKPPDSKHPYGHRELEPIAANIVGAFILSTGIAIVIDSLSKALSWLKDSSIGHAPSHWALIIAALTVILKIVLYIYTNTAFKRVGNTTLKALASDHLNDIMAAMAVVIGIVFSKLGHSWMDPLAGALVAIYIIKTGIEIIVESSSQLMNEAPNDDSTRQIRDVVMAVPGVKGLEELGIHRFGPYFNLQVTISVRGDISIDEGHEIAHKVEENLLDRDKTINRVIVHYHPVNRANSRHTKDKI